MAGMKHLICLSFCASVGMTFLVLACALPGHNWYPFFVLIFYLLSPIPTMIARRRMDTGSTSSVCKEVCIFITTGIVVSAFALPIILARSPPAGPTITWNSCMLVLLGNVVVFATIFYFFVKFINEDDNYNMW